MVVIITMVYNYYDHPHPPPPPPASEGLWIWHHIFFQIHFKNRADLFRSNIET